MRLTPAELEIMQALWRLGETTVHALRAALGDDRTYTTISTLVRILEQKGFVASRPVGRAHLYRAVHSREDYARVAVGDLVDRLFDGDPGDLVRTLIEAKGLDGKELAQLRALLEEP